MLPLRLIAVAAVVVLSAVAITAVWVGIALLGFGNSAYAYIFTAGFLFLIVLAEFQRRRYVLPIVILSYCKRFIDTNWLIVLHVIVGCLLLAILSTYLIGDEDWPIASTIALAALYVAGVQANLAVQHYQSSTKMQMRQATLEHAKFAIEGFRKKERDLYIAFSVAKTNSHQPDHAIHNVLHHSFGNTPGSEARRELILTQMQDFGRSSLAPHGSPKIPKSLAEFLASSPVASAIIREFLLPYEMLAVGVMRKSYGFVSVDGMMGPHLVDVFNRWYPFILYARKQPGHAGLLDCFQFLVSCIVQYRANRALDCDCSMNTEPDLCAWDNKTRMKWVRHAASRKYFPDLRNLMYRRRTSSQLCGLLDALYNIDSVTGISTGASTATGRINYLLSKAATVVPQRHVIDSLYHQRTEWLMHKSEFLGSESRVKRGASYCVQMPSDVMLCMEW